MKTFYAIGLFCGIGNATFAYLDQNWSALFGWISACSFMVSGIMRAKQ